MRAHRTEYIFAKYLPIDYLPAFADYFIRQNAAISTGAITGSKINLIALGIGNGWFDPLIQVQSTIDFSYNNTYSIPIINATSHSSYTKDFRTYCVPQLEACRDHRSAAFCLGAYLFCSIGYSGSIQGRLMAERNFDIYDIRKSTSSAGFDPNVLLVPTAHGKYLSDETIKEKIGATRGDYTLCSLKVYEDFTATGDGGICIFLFLPGLNLLILYYVIGSISYLPNLTDAVNAGINTVLVSPFIQPPPPLQIFIIIPSLIPNLKKKPRLNQTPSADRPTPVRR